ncbi:hypothetical protein F5148DRAFT_1286883 [Russula earlei]|uniref:Uncharacterized protein n=1 Tax=Russula earlei TaxID=71964 RepID=A0ACC0U344_9AGAM|nr:hypothetical protein F5148DRAFT_1286883 [Russula earlei]
MQFATLPVELLYDIQLYAASEVLPLTCRRLHDVFESASPTLRADYLIARYLARPSSRSWPSIITYVLRFPLCTPAVLAVLFERPSFPHRPPPHTDAGTGAGADPPAHGVRHADRLRPDLPKRLFRRLSPSGAEALPLLRFLYGGAIAHLRASPPDADSHDGYPLARAAFAAAVPLVRFLLDHGASPRRRNALAVRLAIKRRDLALVRLLVEPPEAPPHERRTGKRRKISDRVQVNSDMLRLAVTCGARDIAEYLVREKGCLPDLKTLKLLR